MYANSLWLLDFPYSHLLFSSQLSTSCSHDVAHPMCTCFASVSFELGKLSCSSCLFHLPFLPLALLSAPQLRSKPQPARPRQTIPYWIISCVFPRREADQGIIRTSNVTCQRSRLAVARIHMGLGCAHGTISLSGPSPSLTRQPSRPHFTMPYPIPSCILGRS